MSCKPYFPENQYADVVHAATCLETGAVMITNDAHFKRINESGLIEVWNISRAIKELLG
jgi:predicted nucleic acid-binding protein